MDWWVIIAGGVFCGWVAGQKGYTGMLLAHFQLTFFITLYMYTCIHIYAFNKLMTRFLKTNRRVSPHSTQPRHPNPDLPLVYILAHVPPRSYRLPARPACPPPAPPTHSTTQSPPHSRQRAVFPRKNKSSPSSILFTPTFLLYFTVLLVLLHTSRNNEIYSYFTYPRRMDT